MTSPTPPPHWTFRRMRDLGVSISGATPSKDEPRYWIGDIPWVSPKDMKRRFIDSSEDTVSSTAVQEVGLKLVEPPAVLVVVRGMILARTFPVAVTRVPVTINQDMKALRLRSDVEPQFLAWWLEGVGSSLIATIVDEAAHGTKAIRMDRFGLISVPVPPVIEQRTIVDFLEARTAKLDELIARNERLIELLEEKRRGLITHAVTKGLDAHVPTKDSGVEGLGEIPRHWTVSRIRQSCSRVTDGAHISPDTSSADVPFVSTIDIHGSKIDFEGCLRTSASSYKYMKQTGCRPFKDDVLFSKDGTIGTTAVVSVDREFAVASSLVILSPQGRSLDSRWLHYWLNGALIQEFVELLLSGAALRRISVTKVGRLPILVPPLNEQRALVVFLDREVTKIDDLISRVGSAIDHLREFRTALISAAVTGKIDVRGEIPDEALEAADSLVSPESASATR